MWRKLISGITGLFPSVAKVIDDVVTSTEEKLVLRNTLKALENDIKKTIMGHKVDLEKEITKRWQADANSDSWLSKNIRPLTLVYLMILLTFLAFFDGNVGTLKIAPAYVSLFEALAVTAFGGYFVLRGVEKVQKIRKGKKDESNKF